MAKSTDKKPGILKANKSGPFKIKKTVSFKTKKTGSLKVKKSGPFKAKRTTSFKTKKTGSLKVKKSGPFKTKKTIPFKTKKTGSLKVKKPGLVRFLALEKGSDQQFRKKAIQRRQSLKKTEVNERGVIVLSNIPHGFFEGEMEHFFRQFGVLKDVRLVRSKRTGRSCGYAYVEFEHREVAKIVAKSMDGYLTYGKIMKCKVISPELVSDKLFRGKNIRPDNCPKLNARKGAIRKLNKKRTEKQIKRRVARLTSTYSKKLKKLQELGIDLPLHTLLGKPQQQKEDAEEVKATSGHVAPDTLADTKDSNQAHLTLPEDAFDLDPREDVNPDLTEEQKEKLSSCREELAAQIKNRLRLARKTKSTKKLGGKRTSAASKKMVLEVDESDDEVVLKTPPNTVKRYVKMGTKSTSAAIPKSKNVTPKAKSVTPRAVTGTQKTTRTPTAKNKALKTAKGTPKVKKMIPRPEIMSEKLGESTPKAEKKNPKDKTVTPETTNIIPKVEESLATPKTGSKTPKTKKQTPNIGTLKDTSVGKTKTPKAKKLGIVGKDKEAAGGETTPKNKGAPPVSPKGDKPLSLTNKLTPKTKMTPRTLQQIESKTLATQSTATPRKTVALTPQTTPGKKNGKVSQTPAHAPRVTPGNRKQDESVTPVTDATSSKKSGITEATPGKTVVSNHKTPKGTLTLPKATSSKKINAKTPKVTPGKRKGMLELIPDGKSHAKKQKVPVVS